MKIAYNPKNEPAVTSEQLDSFKNDIIFDLYSQSIYAKGVQVGKVYQKFQKSTSSTASGYAGLVPSPDYNSNSTNRFLKEDGTWSDVINASSINSPVYTGNIIGLYHKGNIDLNKPLKNYISSVTPSYVLRYTADSS